MLFHKINTNSTSHFFPGTKKQQSNHDMKISILQLGKVSAFLAFLFTILFVVVQLLQLLRLITYPYDELFIYGTSFCIVIPFILTMLALHYQSSEEKRIWTHAALIFAILYAVFVSANYVVQLATVIPMNLKGDAAKIQVLSQYPHSMFWDFDALGYIFMGISSLFAMPAFEKKGIEKRVRISLFANALATPLIATVYFYPVFSEKLLLLGFSWAITAPWFMFMLYRFFGTKQNN